MLCYKCDEPINPDLADYSTDGTHALCEVCALQMFGIYKRTSSGATPEEIAEARNNLTDKLIARKSMPDELKRLQKEVEQLKEERETSGFKAQRLINNMVEQCADLMINLQHAQQDGCWHQLECRRYDQTARLESELEDRDNKFMELFADMVRYKTDSKRLKWMISYYAQINYYDQEREFWVEYDHPNSLHTKRIVGPRVRHSWRDAIDAAIRQSKELEELRTKVL